jgi:hypothetical protein
MICLPIPLSSISPDERGGETESLRPIRYIALEKIEEKMAPHRSSDISGFVGEGE